MELSPQCFNFTQQEKAGSILPSLNSTEGHQAPARDRRHLSVGKCECCILYLQQGGKLSCLLGGHPEGPQ